MSVAQPERKNFVSVILPTFNEKDNIEEMIGQLVRHLKDYNFEIIVSDDNSPDGTWGIVERLSEKDARVKIIRRFSNKGVAPSIMDGIKSAKGDSIVWMDGDLTMPASLVPKLVEWLKHYDVVVGSRYVEGGGDDRSLVRVITSRLINWLANTILNSKIKDYNSGFIAARREVTDNISFEPRGHGEYCIEFLHKCTRKGCKIKEIGYRFTERKVGQSKTSQYIYSVFIYGIYYIQRIFRARFSKI